MQVLIQVKYSYLINSLELNLLLKWFNCLYIIHIRVHRQFKINILYSIIYSLFTATKINVTQVKMIYYYWLHVINNFEWDENQVSLYYSGRINCVATSHKPVEIGILFI